MGFFVCDFCLRFLLGDCFVWYSLLAVGFLACFFSSYAHAVVFPRLLFYSHAQFPLRDISISFRGGLSRLLFFSYAHAMGFPAYFSAPTPSFRSATYRLASGVGFTACFSSPTPTPWVSPTCFSTPTPSFRSATYRLVSGVGFLACFSSPTPTPWVFPPTFLLPRPVSALELYV